LFERIGDSMEISDIALHWGKEADRTASLIESKLVEFFRERAKRNHGGNWILDSVIDQTWDVHAEVTREDIREFCEHADMPGPRFWFGRCSIPDDHIDPRRSAFFMARSVLRDIREYAQC